MATILAILGVILFIFGAYFMGNKVLDTFDEDWVGQLISSLYGLILWIGIAFAGLLCVAVYYGVRALVNML